MLYAFPWKSGSSFDDIVAAVVDHPFVVIVVVVVVSVWFGFSSRRDSCDSGLQESALGRSERARSLSLSTYIYTHTQTDSEQEKDWKVGSSS